MVGVGGSPRGARGARGLRAARRGLPHLRALVAETVALCMRYRVTGLAAEAGFFAVLSLPPLVLGLAAAAATIGQAAGVSPTESLQAAVRDAVAPFLTRQVVQDVVLPTVVDALERPRVDLISVGFALSVWSGSRALHVYVDAITIMYGLAGRRGIVHTRALSLLLYLLTLVLGSLSLPLLVVGPALLARVLPHPLLWVAELTLPVAGLAAVVLLATLYHVSTPVRCRWWRDLPGALLGLVIWTLASAVLRAVLARALGGTSIYGPLTTAILVLIWLYALALAVLIGAGLNAATRELWPPPGWPGRAGPSDLEPSRPAS